MTNPCFFGYGSLVNRATHKYPNAVHATATGWRRAWVHTSARQFAFLTVVPAAGHSIEGLIAEVPGGDWAALDLREQAYERIETTTQISHSLKTSPKVAIYAVPASSSAGIEEKHPILLSYLDVVLQGYLKEFGSAGADAFVNTTDGWNAPIKDDRADPIYPRHQVLAPKELDYVNTTLRNLGHDM